MNLITMFRNLILFIIMIVQVSFATNYYVDATNGNDNNSGLSPSTAWKTINKVNNYSFASGDIISFKRGETFTGYTLTPPIGNLTFNAYGAGSKPIIDGQGVREAMGINNINYLTFTGIEFFSAPGGGFTFDVNNCKHMSIDSCMFDGNKVAYCVCGIFTNSDNLVVRHSVFQNGNGSHGLYVGGANNVLIEYNQFLNNPSKSGLHINIHDVNNGFLPDTNVVVRYNYFAGNASGITDQGAKNGKYYYNVFYLTPTVKYSHGFDFSENNGSPPSGSMIYNNTFICNDSLSENIAIFMYGVSGIDNYVIKNNIFYFTNVNSTSGYQGYFFYQQAGGGTHNIFNNNLYYRNGGAAHTAWFNLGTSYSSFSSWKALGYDANGLFSNPLMTNYAAGDYSLQSSSPAISAGTNIGLTQDYLGNSVNNPPDIGAYEYLGTPSIPTTPTLASPSNNSTGISINPTLTWNASTGATSYRLQASTNSGFTSTVYDNSTLTSTSQLISGLLNSTIYYWRVSATNSAGTSSYSSVWNFTTIATVTTPSSPLLSSPTNGAMGISLNPNLSWSASSGATTYRLQVSTSSGFSTTVYDNSTITSTSQTISGLSNSTIYYWRVSASNSAGTSNYSSSWSFTTDTVTLGHIYYVDAVNGNDNNSGLTQSSAWKTINKVNNNSFSSGDIISFKRGETFTGYTLTPPISNLTFNTYGTGAKPIIDGQNSLTTCFVGDNKNNLTVNSIIFYNGTQNCFNAVNSNYLTIDSCEFDGNNHVNQSALINSYYANISYCVFKNASSSSYAYASGLSLNGGGYQIIEHCQFLNNSDSGLKVYFNPTSQVIHPIVRYNWFEGNVQNYQDQATDSLEFYYNVIVDNPNSSYAGGMIFTYESSNAQFAPKDAKVFNNTFVMNDSLTQHIAIFVYNNANINNLTFKNNLFIFANSNQNSGYFVYQQPGSGSLSFDNNLFFRNSGNQINFASIKGTNYDSFSSWQTSGFDAHGAWANPLLNNLSTKNYSLLSGSAAVNAGTNVGLLSDYNGYLVPVYKPDIGAFEHSYVQANIKAFLGGPFKNGSMTTFLNSQNLIPLVQPYSSSPWNYAGTESVSSIPSNVVDWVLVQLRSNTSSSSIISQRSAFIKNDGTIVDLDGASFLRFDFVNNGSYYLVIKHRNHLSIMSASPVSLITSSSNYDFTTSQSKAYGTNPMMSLASGIYGMYSGDGDANGGISSTDRNNIWRVENGSVGYLPGDYDLSGGVNSTDINLCWRLNNGIVTQVP